jgi:hypothetical protein
MQLTVRFWNGLMSGKDQFGCLPSWPPTSYQLKAANWLAPIVRFGAKRWRPFGAVKERRPSVQDKWPSVMDKWVAACLHPYQFQTADDSSIAKSLYVNRYKLQSPHTLHRWYASNWEQTTKSIVLENSISFQSGRWLIDCEITLCQKVQTTKSTHSSSLVRFQLGTNYKVHCSGTFLISCRQIMTHRLRNHSMPAQ